MENELIIPTLDQSFEKFDSEDFWENIDSTSGKRTLLKDNLLIIEDHQDPGFSRLVYDNQSHFYALKIFYENGNIKEKGIAFNNGADYGIWYHFNEEGSFIREENTDEGYTFGWKDVITFCSEREIGLEKGKPSSGGIKTEIFKNEEGANKVWVISYYDKPSSKYLEVTLDGETGKQIKERELEMIGN